jgi:hypothetical protein
MIIGICGKKMSGKTFTSNALVDILDAKRLALGDGVKEAAMLIYGLTYDECYDQNLKEKVLDRYPFISPREILQRLGTDGCRDIEPATWVEYLKRNNKTDGKDVHIIEDIRFPNELPLCDLVFYIKSDTVEDIDTHESENSINESHADYVMLNDMKTYVHVEKIQRIIKDKQKEMENGS